MVVQVLANLVDFCDGFEKLTITNGLVKTSIEQVKNLLKQPPETMKELSQKLLECFQSKIEIGDQKEKFLEFSKFRSWNQLKKDESVDRMRELDRLRHRINQAINDFTASCAKEIGLSEVCWRVSGTSGYDSDVDITVITGSKDLEEIVLYKVLRDCIHYAMLGGESGEQLDTECYIPHIAEFDISRYLVESSSKKIYFTGEKAAVILQRYASHSKNLQLYQQSKERDLESIQDCNERDAMTFLHQQVELLMSCFKGISRCKRLSMTVRLAEHARVLQGAIAKGGDVKQLDRLHLELYRLLLVLSALQIGGTFSVAEGKATLLHAGGQLPEVEVRKRRSSMSQFYDLTSMDLLKEAPELGRKASLPLVRTIRNSDEFVRHVLRDEAEKFLNPSFESSDIQTLLIAASEEVEQFQAAFYAKRDIVDASKYALRVTSRLLQALKQSDRPPRDLKKQAEKLKETALNLEKCKRKHSINKDAATTMLSEAIISLVAGRGSTDAIEVRSKVWKVLTACDEEPCQLPTIRLGFLQKTLKNIKEYMVNEQDPKILPILQAYAGVNTENLDATFEEATKLTIEGLDAGKFFIKVMTLEGKVREFARSRGLWPFSTLEMAKFYNFDDVLRVIIPEF